MIPRLYRGVWMDIWASVLCIICRYAVPFSMKSKTLRVYPRHGRGREKATSET